MGPRHDGEQITVTAVITVMALEPKEPAGARFDGFIVLIAVLLSDVLNDKPGSVS